MNASFPMRVLGKGGVASILKVILDVVWIILWVAAGALALGILGTIGVFALIQAGIVPANVFEPGADSVAHVGPVTVQMDAGNGLLAPILGPAFLAGVVAIGGALIIVLRLKRLFKNFTSGEPFSADNASHLRVIWITMLVMELSRYAIAAAVAVLVAVFGEPETTRIEIESPVNLMTWGAILILIVLAEVFREGARLKEEQELTI